MIRDRLAGLTFAVIFLSLLYLLARMFSSFVPSILFGLVLAGLCWPLREGLMRRFKVGPYAAASVICALIVGAVLIPAIFLIFRLSQEAYLLYDSVRDNLTEAAFNDVLFGDGLVARWAHRGFDAAGIEYSLDTIEGLVIERAREASSSLLEGLNAAAGNIFGFLMQFAVMLVLIFGLMVEGPALKTFFLNLSPLPNEDENLIIEKFNQMSYVTLVCNGLGGVIQGVFAGVGFWLAGFESTVLWSTIMIVLAFIPLVGMSVVFVPACLMLWARGDPGTALILFGWCAVVAVVVENWFKPWFMAGRVEINSIVVFFAILGGLSEFGILGIFYGPLLVTVFLTFVQLYHARFVPRETPVDQQPAGG